MRSALHVAALAASLALPATARAAPAASPPPQEEVPCEPVKPCEIPLDALAPAEPAAPADLVAEARRLQATVARGAARARNGAVAPAALVARVRPAKLPSAVVQPFGAELRAALVTYPDLRSVTTLSPEPAGDPRQLAAAKGAKALRAPLARALADLAALGYEPVSLRYFHVQPDGTLRYLGAGELSAPAAFASSELTFVRKGEDPRTQARTHRHVATALTDAALASAPGIVRHLVAKGEFVALVPAGGAELARPDHAKLRDLLLRRSVFIVSDPAAIPAEQARSAKLVQETQGAVAVTRRP